MKYIQNKAMLAEDGAEIVEIIFGLVFAIGFGACLMAVQDVINAMLNAAGDGAADAFNDLGAGSNTAIDTVTYTQP